MTADAVIRAAQQAQRIWGTKVRAVWPRTDAPGFWVDTIEHVGQNAHSGKTHVLLSDGTTACHPECEEACQRMLSTTS